MRIDSSTIGMESTRSYRAYNATARRFSLYQQSLMNSGGALSNLNTSVKDSEEGTAGMDAAGEGTADTKAAGETGTAIEDWYTRMNASPARVSLRSSSQSVSLKIQQYTVRYIFELLFARRRGSLEEWRKTNGWEGNSQPSQSQNLTVSNMWTLSYTQETVQIEEEATTFSTVGTVKTGDGREISFHVNVGMSREFQRYYREELDVSSFTLCDPLVINLDTDVAQLSDQNIFFDIDADGEADEIARLGAGSGYLALDKNGDGIINDGSELFGTTSGDGFADLAKYDEDGDGWIDEDDAIWSKLQIWCMNEKGESVLYRLEEKGVGAICLQNAATDFTLQGDTGDTKGVIRSSGVFLYENGNVGTVQHVDVAKYQNQA